MVRGFIAVIGFLLLVGSAGALDQDVIGFGQFAWQAGLGILMMAQALIHGKRRV